MKTQRGFSLIEVMISFVLLAVALGILVAILGGGLAQVRQADDATGATLLAESLLAEVGVLGPIEPGSTRGESADGRYRWTLEVSEVPDPAPASENLQGLETVELAGRVQAAAPVLYQLQLDVRWGQDEYQRELRFASLRTRYPLSPLDASP
ncbi:prepilin-type N-terminal cleavage/methylation domain-containing protein [Arenimonas sp.]|uniref:type IV pilus modification PilV family protein n=1 Tax=Arenimonas sp. TaxID=1872635 RepID=UPI0035AD8E56